MFSLLPFCSTTARATRVVYIGVWCFLVLSCMRPFDGYAGTPLNTELSSKVSGGPSASSNKPIESASVVAMQAEKFTVSPAVPIPPLSAAPVQNAMPISPRGQTGQSKYNGVLQKTVQDFDATLMALSEASKRNDAATAVDLSSRLLAISAFPATSVEVTPFLRAYIEYFGLKPLLFDARGAVRTDISDATLESVRAFLKRYAGTALADRMRNDYLLVLGAQKNWTDFEANYHLFILNDDVQVKAYALAARAQRGENVAAAARALLTNPRQYGDAGIQLITILAERKQFSAQDVWDQLRLTYKANRQSMAKEIAPALGADAPPSALLDEAALRPLSLLTGAPPTANAVNMRQSAMDAQLTLLALTTMARSNPRAAAAAFTPIAPRLTVRQQAIGWASIAYWGAIDHCPEALSWYSRAVGAPMTDSALEWRVRAALFSGSWKEIRSAIEAMPAALQARPAWVYWLARALQEQNDPVVLVNTSSSSSTLAAPSRVQNKARAQALLAKIAPRFEFYGLLAKEALGQPLVLPEHTMASQEDIARMQQYVGFGLTQRLYAAGLYFEGSREWNWVLRGMGDSELLAAASYAKQIRLYDRVVNTADRTQREYDFSLRYPLPSKDIIERNTQQANLDVSWVYGLIRQESRFLNKAQSGVGAIGYMQVMPRTAQLVARKIGLDNFEVAQLADVQTNTLIGTRYLSMLYDRFDRSAVLATASYNAGPRRAQQWQAALQRPVEGALFAEIIPFDETRTYVKNVLANKLYYAAILKRVSGRQSLKATLGQITPPASAVQLNDKDNPIP